MRPDADLSARGVARLVQEFLERLDLRDVTLVGNDWGGALLLASDGRADRVGRLVIASCEAFDNVPPGLPGRAIWRAARVPGGINALAQPLRLRPLRRLPMAYGWMTKRPVPRQIMDAWLHPLLTERLIRRDLRKYLRTTELGAWIEAAEGLRGFDRPALILWAKEDRVMPPEHGRRLAELFPRGRLVEIPDSYTLIPEDQPAEFARVLREFLSTSTALV
jgi:pimeloyl-ACP methyl ester carboxylesterase